MLNVQSSVLVDMAIQWFSTILSSFEKTKYFLKVCHKLFADVNITFISCIPGYLLSPNGRPHTYIIGQDTN